MGVDAAPSRRGLLAGLVVGFTGLLGAKSAGAATRPTGTRKVEIELEGGWDWDQPIFHGLKTEAVSVFIWLYDGWLFPGVWGGPAPIFSAIVDANYISLIDVEGGDRDGLKASRIRVIVTG